MLDAYALSNLLVLLVEQVELAKDRIDVHGNFLIVI